jgi:Domain of unknown function (DUF397)
MGTTVGDSWRKSSYSHANGGNCAEVGHVRQGMIVVRDTKNRASTALKFTVGA